ncbi:MAG: winged helix-turn-helix domain-containing protein [Planctomycetaceae bacterium]|nr:winged helix-turn-helix domain-containing protein [Planctomycetaceae bacterium]
MVTKKTTTRNTTKAPRKTTAPKASAPKANRKKPAGPDAPTKRLSALDAAAIVLSKAKEPMGAKALIEAMAAQGLWSSPGGQTPHSTLYAAMIREIGTKGTQARFKKVDRGQFTANR